MRHCLFAILMTASLGLSATAQFSQIVGVTGTANAGTSFTLRIEAMPTYVRNIDFISLPVDYSPLALAELMVDRINEDYAANGGTGFEAKNPQKADGESKYEANYEIRCTIPITDIFVGTYPNATSPLPRAPGVGFNPNFTNFESNMPTPYVAPQFGSPNADLKINGQDPDQEFFRKVEIPIHPVNGGNFTFSVSTGSNPGAGVIIAYGPYNPGYFVTPWGDRLDIGFLGPIGPAGVAVVGDGIGQSTGNPLDVFLRTNLGNPATLTLSTSVTPALAGTGVGDALQCVVSDPTSGPFFLRLTQAVQPLFEIGFDTLIPVNADGSVNVSFLAGHTFPFYFGSFPQLTVHENGVLTFGAPGTVTGSTTIDPFAANNGPAAIFVNWADWDLSAPGLGPAVRVSQFKDEFRVRWGRFGAPARHFGDSDQARFEAVLRLQNPLVADPNTGSVVLNYLMLDDAAANRNAAVIGISAGNGFDPNPVSRDLGEEQFSSSSMGSLISQDSSMSGGLPTLQVPLVGGTQAYNNGSKWHDREIFFFPPVSNSMGFFHHSIASRDHANDFSGVDLLTPSISRTQPNAMINLVGYFKYLFSAGFAPSVVLDPNSQFGLPRLMSINGVMVANPAVVTNPIPLQAGFRSFEGLRVSVNGLLGPGYPIGAQVAIRVNFSTGGITIPNAVTIAP